jgi:hypothetical protein
VATRLLNRCFIENRDRLRSRGEWCERLGGSAHRAPVANENEKSRLVESGWTSSWNASRRSGCTWLPLLDEGPGGPVKRLGVVVSAQGVGAEDSAEPRTTPRTTEVGVVGCQAEPGRVIPFRPEASASRQSCRHGQVPRLCGSSLGFRSWFTTPDSALSLKPLVRGLGAAAQGQALAVAFGPEARIAF